MINTKASSPMQVRTSSFFETASEAAYDALVRYEELTWRGSVDSLSPKSTALIALAVSLAIPCHSSARYYRTEAVGAGASDAELAATAFSAAMLRAGAVLAHGCLGFKFLAQSEHDTNRFESASLADDHKYIAHIRKADEATFAGLMGMLGAAHEGESVLSKMEYELQALAVGLTTQCVYCINLHINNARKFGATDLQIADVIHIVGCVRARSTLLEAEDVFFDV